MRWTAQEAIRDRTQPGGVRYEILRRLGGGPFGDVHVARAVGDGLERLVCIKRLAGTVDPEQAEALREEARLLASVRHANVVSLLAFGEDPRTGPFLVLELVDGLDLRTLSAGLLPDDRLADGVAVHIACALLRALSAVQGSLPGLVHRDVTPHNVLVSANGEVKLGDFGIALARDRTRWTRPLFVKGKLGYMAPEQILGAELDHRTDLFAVGVVLYELLTGERPWGPIRGVREMKAVVELAPIPVLRRRPRLDRALAPVVERLIARDPALRFAGPDDALRALAPFGAGELGSLRLAGVVSH
ncbi:MAG: serine/threonine-protein kinase, partial [Polyangiaceae bacterium]